MNRKTAIASVALACAFAMLSSQTCLFAGARGTEYFTPSTRFAIPMPNPSLDAETQTLTQTNPATAFLTLDPAARPDKQAQTPSTTPSASLVPIGIAPENLYIIYAALAVASGILILAATALAIRKIVIEKP